MEEVRKIIREIIKETIRKIGDKYVVYPEKGGKRLGTHSTKAAAEKQLQAIHIQQHNEEVGGVNTSWSDDTDTVTLQDILDLTKNIKIVNYPTEKLAKIVLNWDDNPKEIERINQVEVSKQYPILIMVDENEKIKWILDGNHRAQKALRSKAKTIPAKLIKPSNLDIKSKKILLGITEIKKQLQAIHIQQHNEGVEIKYINPDFEIEWEEANRYPEFKKMGKDNWIKIAKQGKSVLYNSIKDVLGNVDLNFKGLEEPKKERFQVAFKKGVIEMPIAVKFSENDYDLVAGNTRLSGLVNNGINPKIWVVDISNLDEMLNYPNWLRNQAQTPQNNPDGEHRFYLPKKKKIKEFAMGMMSPVEKARHQRNMHKLMKILNKRQVQYFEYPNIPNTLVRKLYEKEQIPGGLAKGMSLVDIAKKHKVKLGSLRQELNLGIKTELEHTTSKSVAREIAMDHLFEDPKYYTKIQKANL